MTTTAAIINAIRADYRDNATTHGQWMPLLWIREGEHTSRFQRADIDAALRRLARGDSPERDILLEEQVNQKTLTEAARRAGIHVGGRNLTEIRIGN
jgi:hypothetical protein